MVAFFRDHTPFTPDWNRIRPAGAAICVDSEAVQESKSSASLFRQQVFDLIAAGQPVTVTFPGLRPGRDCGSQFRRLCELVGEAAEDSNKSCRDLGIVINAACLEARDAWKIRYDELGAGPLYLKAPQREFPQNFWGQLWQLRSNKLLRLVYSSFVVSQTCLLPDETASGIAPGPGLQVPTGSSWVTVDVDVSEFANDAGILDAARLEQALLEAVVDGDAVHTNTSWPTAQMRHDAWLNRRLAINIVGIGTLARNRNIDPRDFSTLDELSDLLRQIREVLRTATRSLADRDGNVPALEQADPGRSLPGGSVGDGWAWRWRQALEVSAVRNRNLLAVSPWSIFPSDHADYCYANLLPLLRFADVCPFGPPPDVSGWNLRDFKSFHQQAAAVLQQRGAAHQIAVHA